MIECPICHVNNDDQAHFCSECGQRFNPSMQSGGAPAAGATPPWQQQTSQPQGFSQPQPAPSNYGQPAPAQPDFGGQSQNYAPQSAPTAGFGAPPGAAGFPPVVQSAPGGSPSPGFAPTDFASAPPTDFGYPQVPNPSSFVDPSASAPSSPVMTPPAAPAPEPEFQEPPKPARPRLHSPILGGHDDEPDEPQAPSSTGKRNLRSPLLRGADDEPPEDQSGQNKSKSTGRLRSPLLRGEDEEELNAPRSSKGGKPGGLRSPLLGGEDDAPKPGAFPHRSRNTGPAPSVDEDEPKPGAFPHRSRTTGPVQPVNEDPSNKTARPRLHSPMLGGGEDDYDEPVNRGGPTRGADPRPQVGGRRRLHSPVLDGTGEFDYEAWGQEDEQSYDEDDPNVLRSPLLAARQKLPVEKPVPPAAPQAAAPTQPLPPPIPQTVSAPQQVPQVQQPPSQFQQPAAVSQPNSPSPQAQAPFAQYPEPDFMQQMATPPAYVPLTSPTPATSLSAHTYAEPVVHAPAVSEPPPPPVAPAPSMVSKTDHKPVGRGRSALHSDESTSRVPLSIYDSGLRETIPGTIKSGPAMILVVPALLALVAKGYYLVESMIKTPTLFQQLPEFMVDNVGQIVVLLGLLIFGLSANKKY